MKAAIVLSPAKTATWKSREEKRPGRHCRLQNAASPGISGYSTLILPSLAFPVGHTQEKGSSHLPGPRGEEQNRTGASWGKERQTGSSLPKTWLSKSPSLLSPLLCPLPTPPYSSLSIPHPTPLSSSSSPSRTSSQTLLGQKTRVWCRSRSQRRPTVKAIYVPTLEAMLVFYLGLNVCV